MHFNRLSLCFESETEYIEFNEELKFIESFKYRFFPLFLFPLIGFPKFNRIINFIINHLINFKNTLS